MRNELTLIERIEAYLNNQLSAADKLAFEQEIAVDAVLQEKVNLQRQLSAGLERTALREVVKKVAKRYKTRKLLKKASIVVLITVIAGVVIWYMSNRHTHHGGQLLKENTPLPAQTFRIGPSADTVLETEGGITFSILANTFTDSNGDVVKDSVDLDIKEALDAVSIMKAGLSTRSGDSLLETGGMFYIAASSKGEALQLQHPIYTEIPTKEVVPGMQLYKGEILANGVINWINPVPLEHDLTPVDIHKLDFYPPKYLKTLFFEGYDTLN